MTKQLEMFFDVISPNSYFAWAQLPEVLERTGAEIVYRPMFLGAVMKMTGNQPPGMLKPRGDWMRDDMARYAKRLNLPYAMNPNFPMIDTRPILNALNSWKDKPDAEAFMGAMYKIVWANGVNPGDKEALTKAVAAANIDPTEFWTAAEDRANKDAVRANTSEAVERGVFGAPTFFAGNDMHFGKDRMSFIEDSLNAAD